MTDRKTPETIADADIDAAAGGAKHEYRERVSFSYGPGHGSEEAGHPIKSLSFPGDVEPGADGKTGISADPAGCEG